MTGEELKALRLKLGLTQQEMAEKLFVTQQTVHNYERGKRAIQRPVEALAKSLTP